MGQPDGSDVQGRSTEKEPGASTLSELTPLLSPLVSTPQQLQTLSGWDFIQASLCRHASFFMVCFVFFSFGQYDF